MGSGSSKPDGDGAPGETAPAVKPARGTAAKGGRGKQGHRGLFRSSELEGSNSLSRDVCIVFSKSSALDDSEKAQEVHQKRNDVFSRMRSVGLDLRVRQGVGEQFQDKVFVLIGAPHKRLEAIADKIGLEKTLKPEYADKKVPVKDFTGYAEYSHDSRELFQPGPESFFTSLERQRMVYRIMEQPPAEIDLDKLVLDKIFDEYFSLPSQRRKHHLIETWVDASVWKPVPVNDIRDYYGEKIAFYFAWLELYTKWLGGVSIISLIFAIVQGVYGFIEGTVDNPALPGYAFLLVVGTVVFSELWKRRQAVLAFTWNVNDFEEEEPPRPEFLRNKAVHIKTGVFNTRGFVEIDDDDVKDPPQQLVFPWGEHTKRVVIGIVTTALMMACALIGTLLVMALKLGLTDAWGSETGWEAAGGGENAAALVSATINACFITFMNYAWAWVSVKLTQWETHRTDTQFEDSLIIKTFAFQFINSYISLFYIAYVQAGGLPLFGFRSRRGDLLFDSCPPEGCMNFLFIQLALLVTSKQLTRFFLTLGPALYSKYKFLQLRKDYFADGKVSQLQMVQLEASLAPYAGTFEEFSEMAIQYGYVTMFAAAFPLGAIICWVTNIAERKSDASRLVHMSRRPRYRGAEDIGTWEDIFAVIGKISVVTNSLILIFTSDFTSSRLTAAFGSERGALVALIIVEHVVFAVQWLVAFLVPDTPFWVDAARTRHRVFIEKKASIAAVLRNKKKKEEEVKIDVVEMDESADDGSDTDDEATWQPELATTTAEAPVAGTTASV